MKYQLRKDSDNLIIFGDDEKIENLMPKAEEMVRKNINLHLAITDESGNVYKYITINTMRGRPYFTPQINRI